MTNATTPNASKDWPMALNDFACGIAFPRIPALKSFLLYSGGTHSTTWQIQATTSKHFRIAAHLLHERFAKAVAAHLLRMYEERAERFDQAESEMKQS
jgi:hypothetical protein